MFKAWTSAADDAEALARGLEAHLNEYADEVIGISYAISGRHHVLVVYRTIEINMDAQEEEAVSVAETIIDQAQA